MRVTFGSIFRNGLIDINRTAEELAVRQREVSSGRRIHLPSDDPSAMAAAMGERSEMAVLDQFTQTTDSVDSHAMFSEKYHLPLRLLSDATGEVREMYGAMSWIPGPKYVAPGGTAGFSGSAKMNSGLESSSLMVSQNLS